MKVAALGFFEPIWSDRILEEFKRAADRNDNGASAGVEIALLRENWPRSSIAPTVRDDLWLPDHNDIHVLSTALDGQAEAIVTLNLSDFPMKVLRTHGLYAQAPDPFLLGFAHSQPKAIAAMIEEVRLKAEALSGQNWSARTLMRKTGLPRLGKWAERA